MRPYEVAIIFDATLDDNVIRERIDAVAEFIRSRGGTPGHVDRWGRRPFAYELKHRSEGYYVFVEVSAEPSVLAEVDRMLTLSDDVLRHRVLRRPEGSPSVAPPVAERAAPVAAAAEPPAPVAAAAAEPGAPVE